MRDSLTVLAILVIVCLTAALVGPYFVDWNAQRALIERKLSAAVGVPVVIAGPIHVQLLPQPVFKLAEVTIGGGDGRQRIAAAEVDVEIALTSLMRGDVDVDETRLVSPRIDLTAAADGGLHVSLPAAVEADRVRFRHVVIRDGALTIAQPGREPTALSGIDLEGEASSLFGPFKAVGRFRAAEGTHPFRLATGAFDGSKLRVKLGLEGEGGRPTIDIDGSLSTAGAGKPDRTVAEARRAGPGFDGTVTIAGSLPLPGLVAAVPWRAVGRVTADRDGAAATGIELRAGTDMRALVVTGEGDLAFGGASAARLNLHGSQLDLDNLAVVPANSSIAPPKGFDLLPRLAALVPGTVAGAPLPVALDLDAGFTTVMISGETLTGLSAHVGLGAESTAKVRLAGAGPDGARVALDGTLELGPAPVFRGHADAALRDASRFAQRVAPAFPAAAAAMRRFLPAGAVSVSAVAELSGVGGTGRDATLTLDRSVLSGTLSYTARVGADRPRLFADLTSDALDLDGLPDLSDAIAAAGDLDLALAFSARAVKVATGPLAALDTGHVTLRVNKTGSDLRLDEASGDVGGASVSASGRIEGGHASLEARLDAPRLDGLAAVASRLAPGTWSSLFRARAAVLSPARVSLRLEGSAATDGTIVPTVATLAGTFDGTRVEGKLKPERPDRALDPATAPVSASLAIVASDDAATLLRQFGLAVTPGAALGTGTIRGSATGSFATGFDAAVDAGFGDTALSFKGRAQTLLGNGHLTATSADAAPLVRAAGLIPAALAGAEKGAPVPADAQADLSWHEGTLDVRQLAGHWSGLAFGGTLNADLEPRAGAPSDSPSLVGALTLDRLPASALFGLALGWPRARPAGGVWPDEPFGPPIAALPQTKLSLKVGILDLRDAAELRNASLTLRVAKGVVTLADITGALGTGTAGGTLTLRRDGPLAGLAGQVSWNNVAVPVPGIAGRVGGTLDVAAAGTSAASLAGGMAGAGTLTFTGASIARSDPGALARTASAIDLKASLDPDAPLADADEVTRTLEAALDRAALPLGDVTGAATLAAGTLRTEPLHVENPRWVADTEATVDLRSFSVAARTTLRARQAAPGARDEVPQVTLTEVGPLGAPTRAVDASAFVNAVTARVIARAQARIQAFEQDVRERASFSRRLKGIQAEQQALEEAIARDRARAADEAARAALDAEIQRAVDAQTRAEAVKAEAARAEAAKADAAKTDAAKTDVGRTGPPRPGPRLGGVPRAGASGRAPATKAPVDAGTPSILADPSAAGRY